MILYRMLIPAMLGAWVCPAAAVTTESAMVTKSGWTVCDAPNPATIFNIGDPEARLWFVVNGVNAGDVGTVSWYRPDGTLQSSGSYAPASQAGRWCLGDTLPISGQSRAVGPWIVKISWNNTIIRTVTFTIGPITLRSQIRVDWSSPLPTTANGGQGLTLGFTLDGASSIDYHVHLGTDPDPASYASTRTDWKTVSTGAHQETVSLPAVSGSTQYYLAIHAWIDNVDYFSLPAPLVIGGNVPPTISKRTIFLVHGLGQRGGALDPLARSLMDASSALDTSRFIVDSGFDYPCAAQNGPPGPPTFGCDSNCTVQNGARALAQYIINANPQGDIVLVGYSLGGLVARDLMLNNYGGVFNSRGVSGLITLGTPNVGYPFINADVFARCNTLVDQMYSDWRSRESDHLVIESDYLYDLNNRWGANILAGQPKVWFAASGTFCTDPSRGVGQGCRNANPNSDGVVCDDSARFNINVAVNKPTTTWSDPTYAHTDNGLSFTVLCGNWGGVFNTLYNPPAGGSLVRAMAKVLNGL